MKAVISSTYHNNYFFFLPIVGYLWNKLGVEVICFVPSMNEWMHPNYMFLSQRKIDLVSRVMTEQHLKGTWHLYDCAEHKEATYAQVARLFAATLYLPDDEVLISGDVDMGMLKLPFQNLEEGRFTVVGADLVPDGQYPMCYCVGHAKTWRDAFGLHGKTYQQALDELLKDDECEHYRANRWSIDQEQMYKHVSKWNPILESRSNGQNQFAQNRVDRDDSFWRDRLNLPVVDVHLWRPGYEEGNFANIMELLQMKFPNDNFDWLLNYRNEYLKLL